MHLEPGAASSAVLYTFEEWRPRVTEVCFARVGNLATTVGFAPVSK